MRSKGFNFRPADAIFKFNVKIAKKKQAGYLLGFQQIPIQAWLNSVHIAYIFNGSAGPTDLHSTYYFPLILALIALNQFIKRSPSM